MDFRNVGAKLRERQKFSVQYDYMCNLKNKTKQKTQTHRHRECIGCCQKLEVWGRGNG